MSNDLDLYVRIAADSARYNAALGVAGRETKHFSELAKAHLGALKGALAEVGLQVGALAFAMNGLKQAGGMETAMNDVASNIKKSTTSAAELATQLKDVKKTAIDVAKVTPFKAQEIVGIQDALLKAGLDQNAIKGKDGAAMAAAQLSALTNLDPTLVGDSLARLGSMFQLKNDAYDDAAESLVRGEAASPGKLQEILQSQKMFGTTANMLGVGFNDSVALAAMMTPLGDSAGSSLNNFLLNTTGNTKAAREAMAKAGLGHGKGDKFKSAYYENGKFIGAERAAELTRKKLLAIKDDTKRMDIARDIFGEEGMRAAMQMVSATTDKTFSGIKTQMDEAIGREEKMAIKMQGFEMSTKAAAGTVQTSFALAFDPFLDDLAKAAQGVNDLAGDLNKSMMDNPEQVANWGNLALGAIGAGGLLAVLSGKGRSAVGGAVGSAASLAGNVAAGKVLQEAAGVTPVYVVNMPSGGPGSGLPDLPGAPKPGAKPSVSLPRDLGPIGNGMAKAGEVVVKAGTVAGQVLPWIARVAPYAAAFGTGYAVGEGIYKASEGTPAGDALIDGLGGLTAKVLAFFGNENASQAVALTEKLRQTEIKGTVSVTVQTAPGVHASVTSQPANRNTTLPVGRTMDGVR